MDYKEYINSEEWYTMKVDLIMTRGCKCQICHKEKPPNALQLHHLTYDRLFNELPSDLQIVCRKCHCEIHGIETKSSKKKDKPFRKKKNNSRKKGDNTWWTEKKIKEELKKSKNLFNKKKKKY